MPKTKRQLKYYVYVSETKVNMLYAQIPHSLLSKLEAEVKFNLHLVDVSFTEKQFDDTLYYKLNVVLDYLRKHLGIGTVQDPQEYFEGSGLMEWAQIHPGVVFFGGILDKTIVGLGGSLQHLLGYHMKDVETGISHTPWLASLLIQELDLRIMKPDLPKLTQEDAEERVLDSVDFWSRELSQAAQMPFEFVARKLLSTEYKDKHILLGTPIYMALAKG